MPALAHIGIGLAAKRLFPKIHLWALLISVMAIDLLSFIFLFATWVSHGLFMSFVWSVSAMVITAIITSLLNSKKEPKIKVFYTSIVIGILVFSHWVLDFIGWPMTVINPELAGVPLLFNDSVTIGLGVYSTWFGALAMDIGVFVVGLAIYLHYMFKIKKK